MFENTRVILASQSARRRELMSYLFDSFEIIPSGADETPPENIPPEDIPEVLAVRKAMYVAESCPDALVIGCDTVVVLDGVIFGKPKSTDEAFLMLKALSGNTHTVVSGVCLCCRKKTMSFTQKTLVTFYPLSDEDIKAYISESSPLDKAGSYGIQDRGGLFVEKINGDHYNVIGFPIARIKIELRRFEKILEGGRSHAEV